jgi:putative NADPH-quinone reductase
VETLILLFHPNFEKSKANRALRDAADTVPGVEIVDMGALYPTQDIALDIEVERLFAPHRIVLQFPIQWYSTPPLLKTWQDTVLTRMFYIHPKEEGERLRGKSLLVAATAGNDPEAYTPQGVNLFSLSELLKPLHSTANRCGLKWEEPFLIHRSNKSSPDELAAAGKRYANHLQAWQAHS